ncbi:MAG: hypothetical protein V9E90_05620 [Saprospiraceae bacterium]|jgi:hypothetical protein
MKKTTCFLLLTTCYFVSLFSQTSFSGTYSGQVNGDQVKLNLQLVSANQFQGTMEDSQQKFNIIAELKESQLVGFATEASMGLDFQFTAKLESQQLIVSIFLAEIGMTEPLIFNLNQDQQASDAKPPAHSNSSPSNQAINFKFPKEAQHNQELTGTWRKEEQYNSGFGDNYMGASSSQKLILYSNGSVADGGSQTTISGSNYLGQSEGTFQALPNVFWYNVSNQLYLVSIDDGKTNTVHLGKYYIENGAMLITSSNGIKSLFYKE